MTDFMTTLFGTRAGIGLTLLRITTGLTFMAHGSQKLFGWFNGPGIAGMAQWFDSLGLEPSHILVILSGCAEFFGGLALVIGLLVRPAALVLIITMAVAIFTVHIHNGFFITNNGFEYAFTLIMICVALIISGAGKYSADQAIAQRSM